ncbi:MAG: sensor histidine kinase, partial [Myxococcaceae bacterium]
MTLTAGGRPRVRIRLWMQLALFGAIGVVAMHAVHVSLGNRIASRALARQEEQLGRSIARLAADQAIDPLLADDMVSLNVIASATASGVGTAVVYCFIVRDGRVVASSIAGVTPLALVSMRSPGDVSPIVVQDGTGRILDLAEPILGGVGVVRLGLDMKSMSETRTELAVQLGLLALAVIAMGLLAAFVLGRRLARPVLDILASADRFDPSKEQGLSMVTLRGSNEIAALGERFNQMLLRLKAAHDEQARSRLKSIDTERMAALGTLVSGMAHEVNNPLAGLRNCVHRLERPELPTEKHREYLSLMREGLGRIEEVVKRLLDFARPHPVLLSPSRLSTLAHESSELVRPLLEESGITCRLIAGPGADGLVLADRHQTGQALVNLLLNAAWVTPKGGEIRLRLREGDGQRGVSIEDDGPGIPVELRERVLNPFFTTKPPGEGTGLGLSVTRSIVEAHQGRLTL